MGFLVFCGVGCIGFRSKGSCACCSGFSKQGELYGPDSMWYADFRSWPQNLT